MRVRAGLLGFALGLTAAACGSKAPQRAPDGAAPPSDAATSSPDGGVDTATADLGPSFDTALLDAAWPDHPRDVVEVAPPKEVVAGPCGVTGGPTCPVTYAGAVALGLQLGQGSPAALLPDGQLFLGGGFEKATDFDFSAAMDVRTPVGPYRDGFVTVVVPGGGARRTWTFSGATVDAVSAIPGTVVALGSFEQQVDLDPGAGVVARTNANFFEKGSFAVKLTGNGAFVWGHAFTSSGDGEGTIAWAAAAAAPDGATYLTGRYDGEVDFDPGPGTRAPMDARGAFFMRLDAQGRLEWVRTLAGDGCRGAGADQIAVDQGGAPWFAGGFQGACAFDHGGTAASGPSGLFIASLTPAGQERSMRTIVTESSFDLALTPARGAAGSAVMYFSTNVAVRAFDAAGAVLWTYALPEGLSAAKIAATLDGGLLVAGGQASYLDPMFVLALDAQRQERWRFYLGNGSTRMTALLADEKDFLIVGTKSPSDDVDPSAGVDLVGGATSFVARYAF